MDQKPTNYGALYIVATPIGNLNDISQKALSTLTMVDHILAEDTRHSRALLSHYGIKKPLTSLHSHNEHDKTQQILQALHQGESFALISDAGTPLISDPGYVLVRAARAANITIHPIPGACALITALSASGQPCDSFTFIGFLPAKQQARCKQLQQCKQLQYTVIAYESAHRILDTILDIQLIYGNQYLFTIAKELTKIHECFLSGDSHTLLTQFQQNPSLTSRDTTANRTQ